MKQRSGPFLTQLGTNHVDSDDENIDARRLLKRIILHDRNITTQELFSGSNVS
jgi:hypothetical protein